MKDHKNNSPFCSLPSCIVLKYSFLLCSSIEEGEKLQEQLAESKQQAESRHKGLEELKATAQVLADMIDPPEGGLETTKTLVERLREAPQKIASYLSENTRQYVVHVLGLIKSYWPQENLALLGQGMAMECSEEDFAKFVEEARPIAKDIVGSLEQHSDVES